MGLSRLGAPSNRLTVSPHHSKLAYTDHPPIPNPKSQIPKTDIDRNTILVVPYTDSGWAALLARVGGLIAEVGGRLSHGAIVAREYGIPAVMDVHGATQLLRDNQRVILDGSQGIVEVLD